MEYDSKEQRVAVIKTDKKQENLPGDRHPREPPDLDTEASLLS